MMTVTPRIFFDFVDPLSFLVAKALDGLPEPPTVIWSPFELRPPPTALVAVDDPSLAERWALARSAAEAFDVVFAPPRLVPWTRKAHELIAHVEETDREAASPRGRAVEIRRRLFEAYHLEGRDIGRVDILVDLAVSSGLDRTGTRAVLDVDRFEHAVLAARTEAEASDVSTIPTVLAGGSRLEGFHNGTVLRTFLGTPH